MNSFIKASINKALESIEIIDTGMNLGEFRIYRAEAHLFGKLSVASSINLYRPESFELDAAIETAERDGFAAIIIYA